MNRSLRFIGLLVAALWSVQAAALDIQDWKTANGARVLYIENKALPMVDVRVVFNAGSARDKIPGTAVLTNGLLDTGAGGLSANEIAERLESVGAEMGNDAYRDMAVVSLRSLSDIERLGEALDVFTQVVAEPDFPKVDFERDRQRMLLSLKSSKQQPSALAQEAFYAALYEGHPYATLPSGTEESVARLLRIHLMRFHQKYYVAKNAVIAIVGDLDRTMAEEIAEGISGALKEGKAAPALASVAPLEAAVRQDIELKTKQSHITIGQPGMVRGDEDYFDLYVGNHILGGSGFASTLMQEIRENRGLAYSVYSRFSPMQAQGPFTMGMQTRNDQKEEAIALLMENVATFIENGPTQAQLDKAVKNITGSAPMRTDSNRKLVEYLALIGFYDLPLDYLGSFNDKVRAVTIESIRDAWQRRIKPENLVTIVVGQ